MSKSTSFHALSPLELLKLVPNSELKYFGQLLGYDPNSVNWRDKIATVIQKQSSTRILNAFITSMVFGLRLKHDVVRFLEKCRVSCVLQDALALQSTDNKANKSEVGIETVKSIWINFEFPQDLAPICTFGNGRFQNTNSTQKIESQ
ncbi:MAG TPA: hypothetical protein VI306_06675 [Pyrinomonadaceae bacterium]